jgi:hypothetical protein
MVVVAHEFGASGNVAPVARTPIKQAVVSAAELAAEKRFISIIRLRHGGCGVVSICHIWNINPQGKGPSFWFLVFMHLYSTVGSIPAKVLPFLEQLFQHLFLPCRVQRQEGPLCKGLDSPPCHLIVIITKLILVLPSPVLLPKDCQGQKNVKGGHLASGLGCLLALPNFFLGKAKKLDNGTIPAFEQPYPLFQGAQGVLVTQYLPRKI